jgi:hypothetical protein
MSLLEEIAAEVKHPGNQACSVQKVLADVDADLRAELITAIRDKDRFAAAAIERALRKRQIKLAANVINRHRRGECDCPEGTKPPQDAQ